MNDELSLMPSSWMSLDLPPEYSGQYQVRNANTESIGYFKDGLWESSIVNVIEWRGCVPKLSDQNVESLEKRIGKFADSATYLEEAKEAALLLARHYVELYCKSEGEEAVILRNRAIVFYRIAVTQGWPLEERDRVFVSHYWKKLKPKQIIAADKFVQSFINMCTKPIVRN